MRGRRVLFVWLMCSCVIYVGADLVRASLDSPCPNIFQYQMDGNQLYGTMHIVSPQAKEIEVNMELSVGNSVEGYNGNIELAYSKDRTIRDILDHHPIVYKVYFPTWTHIPPKITKIYVNGDLICRGPKISINQVQVLTTITLQHTLRINVTPLNSQAPLDGGAPTTDNSNVSPTIQNTINFMPQMPKDPNNIYAGNPFISRPDKPATSNEPLPSLSGNPFFANKPDLDDRWKPSIPVTTTLGPTTAITTTIAPPPQPPSFVTESPKPDLPPRDSASKPFSGVCGRPVTTNSLILHGLDVPRGAYPWLTAIFRVLNTGLTYICSGSLISNKHVVTAAHCVLNDGRKLKPQDLLIILGKLNIAKWVPSSDDRMIEPETIHVHPGYTPSNSDADIAVIELSDVVTFTAVISPICLWEGSDSLSLIVGENGIVVGWGKNEDGLISTAEPKQTSLPIVSQETCLRSSHQFQFITSNRTLCAGFRNNSGPCNGDSGGGLILKKNGLWMLRGIVSMSISDTHTRSCDLTHYVVFTDASKFLTWLKSFLS